VARRGGRLAAGLMDMINIEQGGAFFPHRLNLHYISHPRMATLFVHCCGVWGDEPFACVHRYGNSPYDIASHNLWQCRAGNNPQAATAEVLYTRTPKEYVNTYKTARPSTSILHTGILVLAQQYSWSRGERVSQTFKIDTTEPRKNQDGHYSPAPGRSSRSDKLLAI